MLLKRNFDLIRIRTAMLAGVITIMLVSGCSEDEPKTSGSISESGDKPVVAENTDSTTGTPTGTAIEPDSPSQAGPEAAPMPEVVSAPEVTPTPEVAEPDAPQEVETAPTTAGAGPTQHIIKGVVTQWAPLVLFAEPGDQIVFRQMAGHDTETIAGMIPEGAEPWRSKMGAEGYAVTLVEPGIYLYKCNPHVSLGMVGAVVVGSSPHDNLDAIESHPDNKGMIGRAIRKLKKALDAQ